MTFFLHQGDSGELGLPGAVGEKVQISDLNCFLCFLNFTLKLLLLYSGVYTPKHNQMQIALVVVTSIRGVFIRHNPEKKVHKFTCKLVACFWDTRTM